MAGEKITRRGVYRDLTLSPYEYHTPYGDIFKFSSQKKLEIYRRDVGNELLKWEILEERFDLRLFLSDETIREVKRAIYKGFYSIGKR